MKREYPNDPVQSKQEKRKKKRKKRKEEALFVNSGLGRFSGFLDLGMYIRPSNAGWAFFFF
jgi:hypothetical protein